MRRIGWLACVVVAAGCHRDAPPPVGPAFDPRRFEVRPAPPPIDHAGTPIHVEVEVTARVVEARRDAKLGATLVTVSAGANEGVGPTWTGTILDDDGTAVGAFYVREIGSRITRGTTPLAADRVTGKRVRLATPPPGTE